MKKIAALSLAVAFFVSDIQSASQSQKRKQRDFIVVSMIRRFISFFRDTNSLKIEKAFNSVDRIKTACSHVNIGLHGEDDFLRNVQAVGFDKKNGMRLIEFFENSFASIYSVINRYNSYLAPWNWTDEMLDASVELSRFLNDYNIYKGYFESHQDCLHGWQYYEYYKSLLSIDLTDKVEVLKIVVSFGFDKEYPLLDGALTLKINSEQLQHYVCQSSFKTLYPKLHKLLVELSATLKLIVDVVEKSSEYNNQLRLRARHREDASRSVSCHLNHYPCCHCENCNHENEDRF